MLNHALAVNMKRELLFAESVTFHLRTVIIQLTILTNLKSPRRIQAAGQANYVVVVHHLC